MKLATRHSPRPGPLPPLLSLTGAFCPATLQHLILFSDTCTHTQKLDFCLMGWDYEYFIFTPCSILGKQQFRNYGDNLCQDFPLSLWRSCTHTTCITYRLLWVFTVY